MEYPRRLKSSEDVHPHSHIFWNWQRFSCLEQASKFCLMVIAFTHIIFWKTGIHLLSHGCVSCYWFLPAVLQFHMVLVHCEWSYECSCWPLTDILGIQIKVQIKWNATSFSVWRHWKSLQRGALQSSNHSVTKATLKRILWVFPTRVEPTCMPCTECRGWALYLSSNAKICMRWYVYFSILKMGILFIFPACCLQLLSNLVIWHKINLFCLNLWWPGRAVVLKSIVSFGLILQVIWGDTS